MRFTHSSGAVLRVSVICFAVFIAGAARMPIGTQAAMPQLQSSQARLKFGAVQVGQSETQLIALTNSGQASVSISAIRIKGSGFSASGLILPVTVAAGQSVALRATFTPKATGSTSGEVTITSNASNPSLQLAVTGSGVSSDAVKAMPSSLSFGEVSVGSKAALSVVLTNTRTTGITLSAIQSSGAAFAVSGPSMPMTLGPKQSISLSIQFTPQSAGITGGGVFLSGANLNLPLSGTGTANGRLALSPANLNFGKTELGTTSVQTSTLSATGGRVTITSLASSNSQFVAAGVTFPLTINAGQSVPLNVIFKPSKTGTSSASLSFSSNATDPHVVQSAAGTGTPVTVSLSWSPSTSPVSGYNVYRGTKTNGPYARINPTLDAGTSFIDRAVAVGQTYYYVTTAVNSSGQESSYSNVAEVQVP